MNPDLRLAAIAARQHSTFSLRQAREAGFSKRMVHRRLNAGRWGRLQPTAFRLAGSPSSWEQELFAAWLAAGEGAVVSHTAAARLYGLTVPKVSLEISLPRDRRPRLQDVQVHRPGVLDGVDVQNVAGLDVTMPTRTAIDLCAVLTIDDLVRLFDELFTRRMSSPRYLRRRHKAIPVRGRAGAALVSVLLERYPEGQRAPDPRAERELLTLLSQLPGPDPTPQYPIKLRDGRTIHADAGLPHFRIAVELQSYVFHAGSEAHAKDNQRAVEVAAVGLVWFPVTPWDVRHRPHWVLDRAATIAGVELGTSGNRNGSLTSQPPVRPGRAGAGAA